MNKTFLLIFLFILPYFSDAQSEPAFNLANKIADKMKDTLQLSAEQRGQLVNINMQLHQQKLQARQQYNDIEVIGQALQKIENSRDTLYKVVLTQTQFLLYQQKKRNLVSIN